MPLAKCSLIRVYLAAAPGHFAGSQIHLKYTLNTPCPFASGRESGRESPGAEGEGLVGGEGGDRDRGARDGGTARVRGWERG